MSKIIVIPNSKEMIYELVNKVDGFILPIDKLSINYPCSFNYDEITVLIDYLNSVNKDIFISLNKNMHNKDLPLLEEILVNLDKYKITGIMYYDIAIVNIKNKRNLINDLVWSQEHLTTNMSTINYWYDKGIKYTYLSSEITKREIEEIRENTKSKLLVNIFGYLPIFTSRRHLVDNYLTKFNKEKKNNLNYMYKEDNIYPIIDNELGTITYSSYVLNGLKEYIELDIDYAIFNSFLIDDLEKIIDIFKSSNKDNIDESCKKISDLIKNTDEGFFIKETIYKVK